MIGAPRTLAATSASVLMCLPVSAQEGKPAPSRTQRLIAELADDARWDAAATRLILMGKKAAPDVGKALRAAASEKATKHSTRLLLVLERMGLAASSEFDNVFAAQAELDGQNTGRAFLVAGAIAPIGKREIATQFKNSIRNVMTFLNGPNRANQQDVLQQFSIGFRTAQEKSRFGPDESPDDVIKRAKKTPPSIAVCQQLGEIGSEGREIAVKLVRRLQVEAGRRRPQENLARNGRRRVTEDLGPPLALCLLNIARGQAEAAVANAYLMQHDKTEGLRRRAAQELMMAGPHLTAALPMLEIALKKGRRPQLSPEVTCIALNCLAMLGAEAKGTLERVDALAESENAKVAARAKAAARRIRASIERRK